MYEQADSEPDYASGDHVSLSIFCSPSNHGGCRSRLAICDARCRSYISEANRKGSEADLRLVWQPLPTDSEWCALRPVFFGQSRLCEEVGDCGIDGAGKLLRVRQRQDRGLGAQGVCVRPQFRAAIPADPFHQEDCRCESTACPVWP